MEVFESFASRSISMEDLISTGKYQPCMVKRCQSVDSVMSIQQHHFRHNVHKGFAATHLENFTQHNFSSTYLHSEEDVLISTFEACDIQKTGWVRPVKIVEFLQEVTGQSGNDEPLKGLHAHLDPEELGIAISQETFLSIMKDWIKECRSGFTENIEDKNCFLVHTDGITVRSTTQVEDCAYDFNRETIDPSELLKFIKELEYKSEKLSERNTKLQKTVEGCEEVNIHLQEQIASLRHHLKNSQQALEQSKCVSDELEDWKNIAKTVEEENSNLTHHNQHLERELQLVTEELVCLREEERELQLVTEELVCLREESGALITERDLLKYKIDELSDEKRDLKVSLESIQRNLASKEEQLTEKENVESRLTEKLENYNLLIQELKCEAERLHSQLSYCTSMLTLYSLQEIPLALGSEFSEVTGSSLQVEIKEAEQDGQTIRGIEEEEKEKQKEDDNDQQTDHSLSDFEKELEDCVADTKVINFYTKEEATGYNLPNCISNKERNLPTSYEHFIYLKLFCIAWICAMLVTITCTYLDHLIYPGILVQINPTVIVTFLWNQLMGIQNPHVSLQHSGIPPF